MARNITLAQAQTIVEACKAEATHIGQPMNIAVVDDGGNLVAFVVVPSGVLLRDARGAVAGGVGVSAGTIDEDHQVAEAGRKAFAG